MAIATSTAGTTTTPTITIPVTAAWHLTIGIVLALIAACAFWVHFELDPGHAYRGTAAIVGFVGACVASAYWLWCTLQLLRSENAATREATDAVAEEVSGIRDDLARIEVVTKELVGAVDALQDCYLGEGQPATDRTQTFRDAS